MHVTVEYVSTQYVYEKLCKTVQLHRWSVYRSLCCSNRDLQPCKEFPLGNVVHANRPTSYRYTNIHAIMSGKQNKYPLDNRAGVVWNHNRHRYVLQMHCCSTYLQTQL